MNQAVLNTENTPKPAVLTMAMELSNQKWKLAFGTGGQPRIVELGARDFEALAREIKKAAKRFGLPAEVKVLSCYEAGRDGFGIHRKLKLMGIENEVVDSASIEVSRRKRNKKTDRIDVIKLYWMLIRHVGGEKGMWSIVRVPSVEEEDKRRIHRELKRLQKEQVQHNNRIRSLLATQGVILTVNRDFPKMLERMRTLTGEELGVCLKQELLREHARWEFVEDQLKEIRSEQTALLKEAQKKLKTATASKDEVPLDLKMILTLISLCGVGTRSAWTLVHEFFWKAFNNRREVGSASGLTGTPYNSGDSDREQGISKAGNSRVRSLMVELSWLWLRYQPDSELTKWFEQRFAHGGKRMRRIGIVALARKLLIALWRYAKVGVVPQGAKLKSRVRIVG